MQDDNPQVQSMRSVTKSKVGSATLPLPAPTVYIDCQQDSTTKKPIVLWDDICLNFAGALHVRNQARVLPFLKGADFMHLMPLRIAAIPDVTLDVVVDDPVQQTFSESPPKEEMIVDAPQEDPTTNHTNTIITNTPRRNPVYGLVEIAMENYSHIDHPDFRPKPRAPQVTPTAEQEEDADKATPTFSNINGEPANDNAQSTNNQPTNALQSHQSPQDYTTVAATRDIAPIGCALLSNTAAV
ncbi:MAG: hypothetical protein JOS17DRAFT_807712 [Linnemannia elongata]|nr:MAG: hypothetical protein JOS17DRAFT_807712 [Linnemannia elongata]